MAGWSDSLHKQSPPLPLGAAVVGRGWLEAGASWKVVRSPVGGSSCHRIVPWILEDQDTGRGALGTPLLLYQRQHMRCECLQPLWK